MKLTAYQRTAARWMDSHRVSLLLWRRQAGKSTLFAFKILKIMLEHPGILCTFVSASLAVGSEIPFKTSQIFAELLAALRDAAGSAAPNLASNGEGLDDPALVALFKQGRLEVSFKHSPLVSSRLRVIAPNAATARGYSGFVFMDEIGFIRDFKTLFEAMEPIISRDPSFHLCMATTPPKDDAHYSYEIAAPEPGAPSFPPDPKGHFYTSQAGVPVHRVDAWDADAAGVPLYDLGTGNPVPPERHRAAALDRDAWDRNYALKWLQGSTSALSLAGLSAARDWGARLGCIAAEGDIPAGWADAMTPGMPWAVGYDIATTTKGTSNPSSITVTQLLGPRQFAERLVLRFKAASPDQAKAILRSVIEDASARTSRRPRAIALDATSERYYCAEIRKEFSRHGRVLLVVSSESTTYRGEKMLCKAYLGNLYADAYDDSAIAIPPDRWLADDRRLAKRVKGSFDNDLDSAGNHGDTFDSGKLALYALAAAAGGPVEAPSRTTPSWITTWILSTTSRKSFSSPPPHRRRIRLHPPLHLRIERNPP